MFFNGSVYILNTNPRITFNLKSIHKFNFLLSKMGGKINQLIYFSDNLNILIIRCSGFTIKIKANVFLNFFFPIHEANFGPFE